MLHTMRSRVSAASSSASPSHLRVAHSCSGCCVTSASRGRSPPVVWQRARPRRYELAGARRPPSHASWPLQLGQVPASTRRTSTVDALTRHPIPTSLLTMMRMTAGGAGGTRGQRLRHLPRGRTNGRDSKSTVMPPPPCRRLFLCVPVPLGGITSPALGRATTTAATRMTTVPMRAGGVAPPLTPGQRAAMSRRGDALARRGHTRHSDLLRLFFPDIAPR